MTTTLQKRRYLIESLRRSKEYREGYVDANISNGIAFQIKASREARVWTQTELGEHMGGKAQEQISKLENPNYASYTLKTLKSVAAAFDVALIVRFVPFSQLVNWITALSPDDLAVPSFKDDSELAAPPVGERPFGSTVNIRLVTGMASSNIAEPDEPIGNILDFAEFRQQRARTTDAVMLH